MLLKIDPYNIDFRKIYKVAEILKKGGVVIYPTDTVYAIGCDLNNPGAIQRVAKIQGKDQGEAHFSIVCSNMKCISHYTLPFSKSTFKMMKRTLPGPYTFILNANKNVPKLFNFNKNTVGLRIPDNGIVSALVDALGNPLIASSVHNEEVNYQDYYSDVDALYDHYQESVDAVIDGGPGGQDVSTIVDATEEEPYLIREGKGEPVL